MIHQDMKFDQFIPENFRTVVRRRDHVIDQQIKGID